MASPGRNANIRAERKEAERKARETQKAQETGQAVKMRSSFKYSFEEYRGPADSAFIGAAFTRYIFNSEKQIYIFLIDEMKNDKCVRQSACRMATKQEDTTIYVSILLDIKLLY